MTTYFQPSIDILAHELFEMYDSFKAKDITSCCFTQSEMLNWLHPFEENDVFKKSSLGKSSESREISLYTLGNGAVKVMLWSQMHGDEPTATMALLDIFNFFAQKPGHAATKVILERLTLLVIPMLNPDGAERFTRRTAQQIDMNRDALALETPEARILKETRDKFQPEYGFNLHDQDSRLTVGTTKKIAAIALLAPSTDESRSDNAVRLKAKTVASTFAQILNQFVPGHIAKWDDTFESRAFGDNIQKWGTSTVLVESGGWRGDPHKFFIRKLHAVALLTALYAIAQGECTKAPLSVYEQIPFNMKLGCDILIRNAQYRPSASVLPLNVDVGINYEVRKNLATGDLERLAVIVEFGDLSTFTALEEEIQANGAELESDRLMLNHSFPVDEIGKLLKRKNSM